MKKNVFCSLSVLSFLLLGCNSNEIGVSRVGSPSNVQAQQAGSIASNVSSSSVTSDPTIFFKEIQYRDNLAPSVVGFGFLDRGSTVRSPFILRLSTKSAVTADPEFVPVSNGAVVLSEDHSSQTSLHFTDLETLNREDLLSASNIVSFAANANRDVIGYVNQSGNAFLFKSGHSHQLNLGSQGLQAKRIVSVGTKSEFYVLAQEANSTTCLLFNAESPDPELSLTGEQLALSPRENLILVVNGNSTQVYDRTTKALRSLPITAPIQEASWMNNKTISYWVSNGGQIEIDLFDIETNQESLVSSVDASMETSGMICPVWNNGDLYFADYRDGKNIIFRANKSDGSWDITPFAESSDSRYGLICPSISGSI